MAFFGSAPCAASSRSYAVTVRADCFSSLSERPTLMIGARIPFLALLLGLFVWADVRALAEDAATLDSDGRGRGTAVTLNYCRASFHRIRR